MANKKPKIEAEAEAKITIKVIVEKVKKRVVYAEADHTFVDVLFSFMTLPMGTIVRLLEKLADKKPKALESLSNLYQSLKDFPECYFSTEECKFMLLNPKSVSFDHCRNLKLKIDDTAPMRYFRCSICSYKLSGLYSTCNKAKCKACGRLMDVEMESTASDVSFGGGGVFVSNIASFIVTDEFSVLPYSTAGLFRLFKDLGITDTSQLEETKLDLGSEQMLLLLKMALSSDSPLTCLVFESNSPILDLVPSCQATTFNQSDHYYMKEETSTSSKMLLEVSFQKSTGKFLFADAKGDFVDFVFSFLSIPLGTVVGTLLNGASSIRCMDNLFKSISNMSVGTCLKSQDIKDMLVKPHFGQEHPSKNHIFQLKGTSSTLCRAYLKYLLKDPRIDEVYLKQSAIFFVTDDLVITPSSSRLAINIMNKKEVSFDDVEKYEISIGLEEGLRVMKASLRSRSTLSKILQHQMKI